MTSLLLIVRQLDAVPAMLPPILQLMSKSTVGFDEWSAVLPVGPTSNKVGVVLGPASMSTPATETPSTSAIAKRPFAPPAAPPSKPMPTPIRSGPAHLLYPHT